MTEHLNKLVNQIYTLKEREIMEAIEKMNSLTILMYTNPQNKTYTYRHRLVKSRFENLIRTTKQLKYLQHEINGLDKKI
ncbi:hypothetical protein [Aestuariivivens sediminis]|uniref:hypothetical protein n=1 Tax=Aestuariivivens sediminis TaxID=2913557 RepID=UPI001F58561B|nr:hypothetical protein [Aestuariivivens sediminis]